MLNYLSNWIVMSRSSTELLKHRSMILSHLESLGLRINYSKSKLLHSQNVIFLGTVINSVMMIAQLTPEHALSLSNS